MATQKYMRNYIETLRKANGNAFVEQLYQALKEEYSMYEAQLPPDPTRNIQLRPEHDIRSRLPEVVRKMRGWS